MSAVEINPLLTVKIRKVNPVTLDFRLNVFAAFVVHIPNL
jgi:hypothetical protein